MFAIANGRKALWQWDLNQQLTVAGSCTEVHYLDKGALSTLTVAVKDGKADIPNVLLQRPGRLVVYAYIVDAQDHHTKICETFGISARPKPDDYVYTETEVKTWSNLQSQIGDLADLETEAKENLVAAINEVAADMPSGGGSDGGLSANEKTLLLTLLKNAKYAENVQPAYEQLEALFNGGAIVTYTVTNNLTDLTTDNEAATITAGFPYKATLADADGNKPKSVEVVMGGVDVSGEYYADGVIDIPSVSGELVITAFAKNTYPVIYNLANTPVTCNADLYEDTGLAFGSESADGYTKSWTMVVKVKNVSAGYLWCVNGQKALSSHYENRWNSDAGNKVMTINTYICNTRVSSGITQANPDEVCIVITKEALSPKTATVHYLSWAGEYVADTVTGTYAQFFNSAYAANMMIGGQMGADFVGTIEEFVIYEGIMQEDEIKVVLGV